MAHAFLLHLQGRSLPIAIKRSGRARNMSLRLDSGGGSLVVVLPDGVPEKEALRFAQAQSTWIESRLAVLPGPVPFRDGGEVPLLGLAHVIAHQPQARRGVWAEAGVIHVSGQAEHLPRRVEEFLRGEARVVMAHHARDLATQLGRKPGRISVRDTSSRWGSCSAHGDLSFSWRLVMAPDWVGRYVAAHEVAHLAEMNHGPDFWALVEKLAGDYKAPRAWLKRHGPQLHRYGAPCE
ncbi:putative metal-dependent hydrolase [Paramagnetospirillum magnetotacticum MS-1]|uniref:Putative metal-dependent hydrolase n=1 Tax=Paramagnetospirillum magnetotacticum MS-1 TaxID=272627 RepID=A0A0C2YU10_PARME|nr:M48 family metallopeptidase [Paramagnetospirillum magnetotacticum]KIL98185.1 putative metal-dependent hydrolase [Paramagnetospirillum magnetotacticum MS-1]